MVELKQQHVHSNYFLNCKKMPQCILKAGRREIASAWLVFHVQKCPLLKMLDAQGVSSKHNRWRCRSSEGTCLWKQKNNYLWFDNVLEISFGSLNSILKDYENVHLISPYLCPANWVRSRGDECIPGSSRATGNHLLTYFSKLQYHVKGMKIQWYHHD